MPEGRWVERGSRLPPDFPSLPGVIRWKHATIPFGGRPWGYNRLEGRHG